MNKAAQFIKKHDNFLVAAHINPDGDALGSAYALCRILHNLGKKARVVLLAEPPEKYDFDEFKGLYSIFDEKEPPVFGAAIAVDCATKERLGPLKEIFAALPNANIDHHISNTNYAMVNCVRSAPATGEMIYELISLLGVPLDEVTAKAVYIAIASDTGNFTFSNTRESSFGICCELAKSGLDIPRTADRLFNVRSLGATKLIERYIASMRLHHEGKLCVSTVLLEDLADTGAVVEDCEGLINYARDIEGVEVSILIRQMKGSIYKLSFRSKEYADVSDFASRFGGGGHVRAAGARTEGNIHNITEMLIKMSRDYIKL